MKEDYKKQDDVVEGTKKTANAILLILDNKEIQEKKGILNISYTNFVSLIVSLET